MNDCWRYDYKGGLKAVERKLDIDRKLIAVDGYVAVQLWWDYVNNHDEQALKTSSKYNEEDIESGIH